MNITINISDELAATFQGVLSRIDMQASIEGAVERHLSMTIEAHITDKLATITPLDRQKIYDLLK